MHVLIVHSRSDLGAVWQDHFMREDAIVTHVRSQRCATMILATTQVDVIILDLMLKQGAALAVADYAFYRQPKAQIIVVTDSPVFADGSIFRHIANARAYLPACTPPADLFAMAHHFVMGPQDQPRL